MVDKDISVKKCIKFLLVIHTRGTHFCYYLENCRNTRFSTLKYIKAYIRELLSL